MYQFRTYGDLCHSKKFFDNKEDIVAHLKEVVRKTNQFRKGLDKKTLQMKGWEEKVMTREIWSSCEILNLDKNLKTDWEKLIGQESAISNPLVEDK